MGWHEVWAAGVTYLRSKQARMEESDFSATAYDRVYAAQRPEIFLIAGGKSRPNWRTGRNPRRRQMERARTGVGAG